MKIRGLVAGGANVYTNNRQCGSMPLAITAALAMRIHRQKRSVEHG